jgi:hypothetical protein
MRLLFASHLLDFYSRGSRWIRLYRRDSNTSRCVLGCHRDYNVHLSQHLDMGDKQPPPVDVGTCVSVVPVRLRPHVKLKDKETCKLVGRRWDWGVVGGVCNNICYRLGVCVL